MTQISTEELKALCQSALLQTGMNLADVTVATDHYLTNEMSGKSSHGIVRVIEAANAVLKYGVPKKTPELEFEKDGVYRFNANRQIGAVAVQHALTKGLEKAQERPMSFIGVRDYIASTGSLSYYLRQASNAKMIAIMGCNSVALVAPPGGKKRMIGTNPFGIAIPSSGDAEMIGDFATSAIAYGKIMVMNDKGDKVPEGVLIDKDGNESTEAKDAYNGAILPLENHKGFALGLMIELLAGPLIGAKAMKQDLYDNDGCFIILINPKKFGSADILSAFKDSFEQIHSTPKRPNTKTVNIAGERSEKYLRETLSTKLIDVADETLKKLKKLAKA